MKGTCHGDLTQPLNRQHSPCPLLATADLDLPEADSLVEATSEQSWMITNGWWGKRQGRPLHPLPIDEAIAKHMEVSAQPPSLQNPHPDCKWYYQDLSAHPKPPSTQDLGDNLGLEAYSGECSKHLLF